MTNKKNDLKVLMMSAEVSPFVKIGGLADVAGSLPKEVEKLNCDVRVIMPLYEVINQKIFKLKKIVEKIDVPSGNKLVSVDVWQSKLPGSKVKIYFIDCPKFFAGNVYGNSKKDSEKFLFFSYAALFVLPALKFFPQVIHCHDSHTAMVPDIIKVSNFDYLQNVKTLYTIHNFRYQGKSEKDILNVGNLKKTSLKALEIDAQDGDINFTVQGVLGADLINTVSEKYAKEILTKEYGEGLEKIIRKRYDDLFGIVNGIDLDFFNPETDKNIKKNFSLKKIDDKLINKLFLQKKLNLPIDEKIPLASVITRFANQKGIELFTERFVDLPCQFVFLGTGEKKYENQIKKLAKKYPDKISANILFNASFAQEIYAASDLFLMPSRFEPCGLGQMIAMRYGAIPVVRATGGLDDTVDEKVGFKFEKMLSSEFYKILKKALDVYHNDSKKWHNLKKNCMKKDFSWNASAKKYLKLYLSLTS